MLQVTHIATGIGTAEGADGAAVSLSDRMTHALANSYVTSGEQLSMIQAASNDPYTASNPAHLFALQTALADYTKRMTVAAGLANHMNKTFETLLKS
ncbi:type III secretion system inner rod subunit SctI [Stenotrophomonas sp.]|uniref:type III secretion system inner rod subunit SctI n=1 Tax=Stenotrophomonas sp. TaxID=69392 RepID=UPI0028AB15B6|nr:type III secretion system inner rod subunit SctI [Stenotrophomonas sp.]